MMRLPPFLMEQQSVPDPDNAFRLKRRHFMRRLCSSTLAAAAGVHLAACRSTEAGIGQPVASGFLHGVASGDPLADRVILWTRITPDGLQQQRAIRLRW